MSTIVNADSATNPFAAFNTPSASQAASGAQAASSASTTSANGSDIQDRFLALLVAQMKNQDPLNPMDNSQVTSQMAQISTVDGVQQLNQTLAKLMASDQSSQALQAASLVGRDVLSDGNQLALAGGSAQGGFDLPSGADQVSITVTSASGQVVHRATLGNMDAGVHTFTWDGQTDAGSAAADGQYTFSVSAQQNGKSVSSQALSISRVDGVSNGTAGISLSTSAGALDWSKIKQVM